MEMKTCGWLQLSESERMFLEDELHRLIDDAERKMLIAKIHAAKILHLKTTPDIPTWYRGKSFAN